MVAVMWDDEVWLPPNITWEYFDHDDRLFDSFASYQQQNQ